MNASSAARLILGLALLLVAPATNQAQAATGVPVHVRAVTFSGQVLVDRVVRTGTTTVPTSAGAACLGGSPSNGSTKIDGSTALGALHDATRRVIPRKPLLLSNAFDFGLGICGVGSSVASGEQWWELTHNHRPSMLGGEGTKLKAGDDVLWFLSKSYNQPSPDELALRAPDRVGSGLWTKVRVLAYNDAGRSRPVEGARLNLDGVSPTDAAGYARIRLTRKTRLIARANGFIPSNRAMVTVRK